MQVASPTQFFIRFYLAYSCQIQDWTMLNCVMEKQFYWPKCSWRSLKLELSYLVRLIKGWRIVACMIAAEIHPFPPTHGPLLGCMDWAVTLVPLLLLDFTQWGQAILLYVHTKRIASHGRWSSALASGGRARLLLHGQLAVHVFVVCGTSHIACTDCPLLPLYPNSSHPHWSSCPCPGQTKWALMYAEFPSV